MFVNYAGIAKYLTIGIVMVVSVIVLTAFAYNIGANNADLKCDVKLKNQEVFIYEKFNKITLDKEFVNTLDVFTIDNWLRTNDYIVE